MWRSVQRGRPPTTAHPLRPVLPRQRRPPRLGPHGQRRANFTLTPHLVRPRARAQRHRHLPRADGRAGHALNPHKAATFWCSAPARPPAWTRPWPRDQGDQPPLTSLEFAIGLTKGGGGVVPSLAQSKGAVPPGVRNPLLAFQRVAGGMSPGRHGPGSRRRQGPRRPAQPARLPARRRRPLARARGGAGARQKMDLYLDCAPRGRGRAGRLHGRRGPGAGCTQGRAARRRPSTTRCNVADMPKASHLCWTRWPIFACGVTRVMTMMWGGGECEEDIDFMGIRDWHITPTGTPTAPPASRSPKLQAYLAGEYAYFVQKLKSYGDGPGSPFDSTVSIWGTQNGNTNQTNFSKEDHDRHNTLFVLSGRWGGGLKLGRCSTATGRTTRTCTSRVARAFGLNLNTVGDPSGARARCPDCWGDRCDFCERCAKGKGTTSRRQLLRALGVSAVGGAVRAVARRLGRGGGAAEEAGAAVLAPRRDPRELLAHGDRDQLRLPRRAASSSRSPPTRAT